MVSTQPIWKILYRQIGNHPQFSGWKYTKKIETTSYLPKQSERELPSMGMAIWGGIDLNKSLNQYGIFQAKNSSYLVFFFKDVPGIGGGNMNVLISAFIFCVGFRIFLVWCKV